MALKNAHFSLYQVVRVVKETDRPHLIDNQLAILGISRALNQENYLRYLKALLKELDHIKYSF